MHLCIFCVFLYLCYCAVEKGGYKLAVTVARFTSQSSANSKPSIQQVPPEIIQSCNNTGGQFTIQGRCRNYRREIEGVGRNWWGLFPNSPQTWSIQNHQWCHQSQKVVAPETPLAWNSQGLKQMKFFYFTDCGFPFPSASTKIFHPVWIFWNKLYDSIFRILSQCLFSNISSHSFQFMVQLLLFYCAQTVCSQIVSQTD